MSAVARQSVFVIQGGRDKVSAMRCMSRGTSYRARSMHSWEGWSSSLYLHHNSCYSKCHSPMSSVSICNAQLQVQRNLDTAFKPCIVGPANLAYMFNEFTHSAEIFVRLKLAPLDSRLTAFCSATPSSS